MSKKALREKYLNRDIFGGVYKIRCQGSGNSWIRATTDLKGAENRFNFSKNMNTCIEHQMRADWQTYGGPSFTFEILESLKKKETQTFFNYPV